jgi:hypothetical protein
MTNHFVAHAHAAAGHDPNRQAESYYRRVGHDAAAG